MTIKIIKATARDKRHAISVAINDMGTDHRMTRWYDDHDENYVYFSEEEYMDEGYKQGSIRVSYTYDGVTVILGDDFVPVVRQTEYTVVQMDEPEEVERSAFTKEEVSVFKKFVNFMKGGSDTTAPVIKQFEEEEMVAIEPLYIAAEGVDLQGDTISREDTDGMVTSLNKAIADGNLQSGLFHKHKSDAFILQKAWVNEVECTIGEHIVPEGMPLVKVKFSNDKAWQARKEGKLMGLSIGCTASEVEILNE